MSGYCVGLTGGLASGKTTAGKMFAELGAAVEDADAIAAELTGKDGAALPDLRRVLGSWAVKDGALNRQAVRKKIFADPALRRKLEEVLHPQIRAMLRERLRRADAPYAVGIVPLLFESGGEWREFFQRVVVVHCRPALQRSRALARDAAKDADGIMAAQMPAEERLRLADDVIENGGDLQTLAAAVGAMHQQYLQSAKIFPASK